MTTSKVRIQQKVLKKEKFVKIKHNYKLIIINEKNPLKSLYIT